MKHKKKKVLFVGAFKKSVKGGATGGVQSACNSLVDSILKEEYDFILVDTSNDTVPPPPIWKKVHKLAFRNIKVYLYLLFSKIDTLIAFSSSGPSLYEKGQMIRFANFLNIKTVFAPISGDLDYQYNNISWVHNFLPKVLRSSKYVLCQSPYWLNFFNVIEDSKDKYRVIYNWIDVMPFDSKKDYASTTLNLVYMGWFEKTKGIYELLESVRISICEEKIPSHLHLCGGGQECTFINEYIDKHKLHQWIKVHGWVHGEKKANIWNIADVFVMPTYFEGFPNAMIEAMNNNIPVIISEIPAIKGFVINNHNGLLSKVQDVNSLVDNIKKLAYDSKLRKELAMNAKLNLYKHNSIDIAIKLFREIL